MLNFGQMLLKGLSQIFFQESLFMGALVAIGLVVASPMTLLLALIGGATSALVCKMLGYDQNLYEAGVAAYNGILIGCAVAFYIKSFPTSLIAVVIGSALGGLIFLLLVKYHITPYALPFVIIAFLLVIFIKIYGIH